MNNYEIVYVIQRTEDNKYYQPRLNDCWTDEITEAKIYYSEGRALYMLDDREKIVKIRITYEVIE